MYDGPGCGEVWTGCEGQVKVCRGKVDERSVAVVWHDESGCFQSE